MSETIEETGVTRLDRIEGSIETLLNAVEKGKKKWIKAFDKNKNGKVDGYEWFTVFGAFASMIMGVVAWYWGNGNLNIAIILFGIIGMPLIQLLFIKPVFNKKNKAIRALKCTIEGLNKVVFNKDLIIAVKNAIMTKEQFEILKKIETPIDDELIPNLE